VKNGYLEKYETEKYYLDVPAGILSAFTIPCLGSGRLWLLAQEIEVPQGVVVVYQPQPEKLEGNKLSGLAAVAVEVKDKEPVFGAIWFEARLDINRDERIATITAVTITNVRFPVQDEKNAEKLKALLEEEMPKWNIPISMDELMVTLELAETRAEVTQKINTDPPIIIFMTEPAVLITLDGKESLQEIEGSKLKRVVNTPFTILFDSSKKTYYLYADKDTWYTTSDMKGDWTITKLQLSTAPATIIQAGMEDTTTRVRPPGAFMYAGILEPAGALVSVTVMDRSGLPSATVVGIWAAGGDRHAATPIAMDIDTVTGMEVGQGTGQAVEILVATICIIQNKTRHAPKPNRPGPINARQLNVPPPDGPTTFTPTGTATSTVRPTRDGSSAPTRAGSRKTRRPRPSSKGTGRLKLSSKGTDRRRPSSKERVNNRPDNVRTSSRNRDNSRPNSLTAATRHDSKATREPTVITSPAAVAAGAAAAEAVAVEVVVVGTVAVAVDNFLQ